MSAGKKEFQPRYGGLSVREEDCSYVWQIPVEKRCSWVKETDDCKLESFIPYLTILFCKIGSENITYFFFGVIGLFLWILYLFLILGTTADNFFVPNLSAIAHVLQLSENIAGVTILAFGNGAPDIFTSIVANEEEKLIMFTELIGAGVFVTAIIVGTVVVFAPFKVHASNFMRDALFYSAATCWIAYISSDLVIHFWEALSCIVIYILFILAVIWMQRIQSRDDRRKKRIPTVHDPDVLRAFVDNRDLAEDTVGAQLPKRTTRPFNFHGKIDLALSYEYKRRQQELGKDTLDSDEEQVVDDKRPTGLFREFFYDVTPINPDDWKKSNLIMKLILLVRVPFILVLQLSVPTVVETAVNHGWSKLLNCVQIFLTPLLMIGILRLWHVNISIGGLKLPMWGVFFSLSSVAAIIIFMITSKKKRPKYHNSLAFVGFIKAMLVVYGCAGEVMAVLQCLGWISGISDAMLGITLLAWGNSIGDLISNVTIARKGFSRMGLSACFGGPMFNTLMGLGLSFTISTTKAEQGWIPIRVGNMAPGCLAFLMLSLMSSIIYLNCTGFIARRSYGYLLYSIYAVFMIMNVLSEIHFIHPLGTDHRPDDYKPKPGPKESP